MIFSWIAVGTLAACAADDEPPTASAASCIAVREHTVELQLDAAERGGAVLTPELVAAHRAALHDALGDEYLAGCRERGTAWVDCALRAADPQALDACGEVSR